MCFYVFIILPNGFYCLCFCMLSCVVYLYVFAFKEAHLSIQDSSITFSVI
jgi:hypothetical protein